MTGAVVNLPFGVFCKDFVEGTSRAAGALAGMHMKQRLISRRVSVSQKRRAAAR